MAHSSPPVALRVLRPFTTERELLEAEASAFTRTGVVLIGAQSRPNGVVLRFEIALKDGTPVMRGEGRVVGFRAGTASEEAALMLRFTRLDVKSKALLDRAVAMREERRSLAPPRHPTPSPGKPKTPPPPPRPSGTPPPLPVTARTSGMPRPPTQPPGMPSVRPPLPSAAPFAAAPPPPPPMPNLPEPEEDLEDAEEVDDGELEAHEISTNEVSEASEANQALDDLTVQQPPVAAREEHDEHEEHDISPVDLEGLEGDGASHHEMLDELHEAHPIHETHEPGNDAPVPLDPISEPLPLLARHPHEQEPEPAPVILAPEPVPFAPIAAAPERAPVRPAAVGPVLLDADSRSGALDRLRARARSLAEADRAAAAKQAIDPSLTPVLGSLTQLRK